MYVHNVNGWAHSPTWITTLSFLFIVVISATAIDYYGLDFLLPSYPWKGSMARFFCCDPDDPPPSCAPNPDAPSVPVAAVVDDEGNDVVVVAAAVADVGASSNRVWVPCGSCPSSAAFRSIARLAANAPLINRAAASLSTSIVLVGAPCVTWRSFSVYPLMRFYLSVGDNKTKWVIKKSMGRKRSSIYLSRHLPARA